MTLQTLTDQIKPIIVKHGVSKAGFFGSVARNQTIETSDIDILVQIDDDSSLLDYIRLKNELEYELKKKVDLVEYGTLKQVIRDQVLAEEVVIYDESQS